MVFGGCGSPTSNSQAVLQGMRHGSYEKLDDDGLAPPVSIQEFVLLLCFVLLDLSNN